MSGDSPAQREVTRILQQAQAGDSVGSLSAQLLPLVYEELRRLAAAKLERERPGQTLQATALVHEAYLRLLGDQERAWDHRGHFFAAAAEAMRRILVENARRKHRVKHGGNAEQIDFDLIDVLAPSAAPDWDLLALEEALVQLEQEHPRKAELVKLRYFAGVDEAAAADMLGISRASAARDWAFAKAWLFARLQG